MPLVFRGPVQAKLFIMLYAEVENYGGKTTTSLRAPTGGCLVAANLGPAGGHTYRILLVVEGLSVQPHLPATVKGKNWCYAEIKKSACLVEYSENIGGLLFDELADRCRRDYYYLILPGIARK